MLSDVKIKTISSIYLGISEFSGRVASVIGGVVFIISLYFIARFFTNRKIALLTLFAASLFPAYLGLFRYARMYAILLPPTHI